MLSTATEIPGVNDYLSSKCRKIYGSATYKLSDKLFDCVPEDLTQFLDGCSYRARHFGSDNDNGILEIPKDLYDPVSYTENLISQYGLVNLERIR